MEHNLCENVDYGIPDILLTFKPLENHSLTHFCCTEGTFVTVRGRNLFYLIFLAYFITFKYVDLRCVGFYVLTERSGHVC